MLDIFCENGGELADGLIVCSFLEKVEHWVFVDVKDVHVRSMVEINVVFLAKHKALGFLWVLLACFTAFFNACQHFMNLCRCSVSISFGKTVCKMDGGMTTRSMMYAVQLPCVEVILIKMDPF